MKLTIKPIISGNIFPKYVEPFIFSHENRYLIKKFLSLYFFQMRQSSDAIKALYYLGW